MTLPVLPQRSGATYVLFKLASVIANKCHKKQSDEYVKSSMRENKIFKIFYHKSGAGKRWSWGVKSFTSLGGKKKG